MGHRPPITNILVGGFCSSAAGYEPLRAKLQETTSYTTQFVQPTRWSGMLGWWSRQCPRPLYRQARNLSRMLRQYRYKEVVLIGHSLGGVIALWTAYLVPRYVRAVILLNSGGIHVDGPVALGKRFRAKIKEDRHNLKHHPDEAMRALLEAALPGVWRYLRNPKRSAAEALALGRHGAFELLHAQIEARGVKVYVAHSTQDTLFPFESVQAILDATGLPTDRRITIKDVPHDSQFYAEQTVSALMASDIW